MSNDLAVKEQGTLAVADVQSAFRKAAEERKGINGTFLKFNKGDWEYGEAGTIMPANTKMIAVVSKMKRGWIKWEDGKPVEQRITLMATGERMPNRKELGDLDQTEWGSDDNGNPRDPWQKTYYLPMVTEKGVVYTYTTSSVGGENCCLELGDHYAQHIGFEPTELPVVQLGSGSYLHKIKSRGRVKFPTLVICKWVHQDIIAGVLNQPASSPEEEESEDPGYGMDEEIPF